MPPLPRTRTLGFAGQQKQYTMALARKASMMRRKPPFAYPLQKMPTVPAHALHGNDRWRLLRDAHSPAKCAAFSEQRVSLSLFPSHHDAGAASAATGLFYHDLARYLLL